MTKLIANTIVNDNTSSTAQRNAEASNVIWSVNQRLETLSMIQRTFSIQNWSYLCVYIDCFHYFYLQDHEHATFDDILGMQLYVCVVCCCVFAGCRVLFFCVCLSILPLSWLFHCGTMVGFVLIFAPASMRNTKTIGFLINDTGSEKCLYFLVTGLQQ